MKVLFLLLFSVYVYSKFDQQHAVLKYTNENYIKDVKVLTGRSRRNEPYRTNCTITAVVPFGNNVTEFHRQACDPLMASGYHCLWTFATPKVLQACCCSLKRDWNLVNNAGTQLKTFISYKVSGVDFTYKFKFCEIIKHKWLYDFVKSISDLFDYGGCPFKARTYSLYNFELPPKNCPLPLPQADTTVIYRYLLTSTEEVIFELQMDIKVK